MYDSIDETMEEDADQVDEETNEKVCYQAYFTT
jgi:hypothetical protein